MAIAFAGNNGKGTTAVFGNTVTFATGRIIAVGEKHLVSIQGHTSLGAVVSVGDGTANTYAVDIAVAGNTQVEVWRSDIANQVSSGATVTVTFTSSQGADRSAIGDSWTSVKTGGNAANNSNDSFGAAATTGSTGVLPSSGCLVVALTALQGSTATIAPDTGAGYTETAEQASGGDILEVQYQVIVGTTAQNVNSTWTGSTSWNALVVAFEAAAAPSVTTEYVAPITLQRQGGAMIGRRYV
jgi:hypothetical protein